MIRLKSDRDIEKLKISGRILAETLALLKNETREGLHLFELDKLALEYIQKSGAKPAFLGYQPEGARKPYPASICTSVNEVVVHGIPREYRLKNGDVLKIDAGVNYEGYFTDSALTVIIGKVPARVKRLLEITEEALTQAISVCAPGNHLGDIGYTIERLVKKEGFKIIRGLTGHGVGFELHEDPTILNFGRKGEGLQLKPGMVLAIEPMVSIGSEYVRQKPDESYATEDGSISAHFEHTIAITEHGCEILTK